MIEKIERENRICTLYKISNTINNKKYVGQTWEAIETRFNRHKDCTSHCFKLVNAMLKHGVDNFYIEALDTCNSQEEANRLEDIFIDEHDSINNGYNIKRGGSHGLHSEETKLKMKKSHTGLKDSDETKAKKSASRVGMKFSEEHKANISKSKTGVPVHTEEHKKELSESFKGNTYGKLNLGRKDTEEVKMKKSISATGRILDEATKAKMSVAKKGKPSNRKGCTFKLVDGKRVLVPRLENKEL